MDLSNVFIVNIIRKGKMSTQNSEIMYDVILNYLKKGNSILIYVLMSLKKLKK
jgi:hypothetical protein